MTYTLVEPCSGSAAFTLYLLGATRAILPYQGSKWRFRRELETIAQELGFAGRPKRVVLTDPGPWGTTLGVVLRPVQRKMLIGLIEAFAKDDPHVVFERLHGKPVAADPVEFAAQFLFLQRLSFSGKAVGVREGRWVSPGFNKTSAYGVPATERFGAVSPMIPSLARVLKEYDRSLCDDVDVVSLRVAANVPERLDGETLVYLDPPYVDSTRYPDGEMSRAEVVRLARRWTDLGAAVMISEQHALDVPGWERRLLSRGRDDTSPFRGKQQEWVTLRASDVLANAAK